MHLQININDLLTARTVEWERLEFKSGWNPEAVLHTMCVFADDFHNLGGGYIVIGIEEKDGSPKPEFETDDDRLHFLTRLPVHPKANKPAVGQSDTMQVLATQSPSQSPPKSHLKSPPKSIHPFERLLIVLQKDELSSGELRSVLKIKHRPPFRVNYLHPALEAGLIEPTIPEKPNSRLQKYRLTEKGRKYKESVK